MGFWYRVLRGRGKGYCFNLGLGLGFGVVLGGALVLDCIWDFGLGFGRCFVYWRILRLILGGGLRNGVKV